MGTTELVVTMSYGAAMFCFTAVAVQLSGYFPAEARPSGLHGLAGNLLIVTLMLSGLAMLAMAIWAAVTQLSWPVAIIAGGLGLLSAPLGWQILPRRVIDSRLGVAGVVTLSTAVTLLLANINSNV